MLQIEFKGKPAIYIIRCQCLLFFFSAVLFANAQTNQRVNAYNNWDEAKLYKSDSVIHTAWKPVLHTDSFFAENNNLPWLNRKIFNEHLLQVQNSSFNIYGDIIVDENIGKSSRYAKKIGNKNIDLKTPGIDTRGFELRGNIDNKVYFETNFYENQGKFGGYIDSFIRKYKVIPGQATYKNVGDGSGFDFSVSSAKVTYIPNTNLLLELGYGKNFIGDGYRSLLLSSWSVSYPYFRVALTLDKFQYSIMWSEYNSLVDNTLNNNLGYFRKWSQTYLVDWKISRMITLSLFQSVIWPDQVHGVNRKKDISAWLISPIIFLHGRTSPSGISNNDIVGMNAKTRICDRTFVYGQIVINELGKFNSWSNRTGFQLGIRSCDLFKVANLNLIAEFNTVRPYTYAGSTVDVSYSNTSQSLAHPLGANFKEGIFVVAYAYKKWWFRAEGFIAKYGIDTGKANYGFNIYMPLPAQPPVTGNVTVGQGVSTNLKFINITTAYILNSASNLRVESGLTYRNEYNNFSNYKDVMFYIGIRMSFRSLMYDF